MPRHQATPIRRAPLVGEGRVAFGTFLGFAALRAFRT
jgi:hypothetical protein